MRCGRCGREKREKREKRCEKEREFVCEWLQTGSVRVIVCVCERERESVCVLRGGLPTGRSVKEREIVCGCLPTGRGVSVCVCVRARGVCERVTSKLLRCTLMHFWVWSCSGRFSSVLVGG